jgi:hypothetical protein
MRTPLVLGSFSVALLVVGCSGSSNTQVTGQSSGGLTGAGGTSATRDSVTTGAIHTGGTPNSGGSNSGGQSVATGGVAGGTASVATSSAIGGTTNVATSDATGGTTGMATSTAMGGTTSIPTSSAAGGTSSTATGGVAVTTGGAAGGTTNVITGSTAGGTSGVSTGSTAGGVAGSGGTFDAGGSTSSGGVTGTGGTSSGTASTTQPDSDASCVLDANPVHLTQVNILFLLDRSGSMGFQNGGAAGTWDNCATRWNPVVDALNSFFAEANSSRTYASLTAFPADGVNTAICNPASYSTGTAAIKVPLVLLDDAGRQNFQARLCDCANGVSSPSSCIVPGGGTPTRPALQGTISYAADLNQTTPNGKTVIVLITDGLPSFACQNSAGTYQACNSCDDLTNGCLTNSSLCSSQDAEISKIAAVIQSAPSRSIYIAGVGDNLSYTTLSVWAASSGNSALDLRDLSGAEATLTLMSKLDSIRSSSTSCTFDLPLPADETSINPDQTNVEYTTGAGAVSYLPRTSDGTASTCSNSVKGWYFDTPTAPKKILLCPSSCNAMQQDSKGLLRVVYGCSTQVQTG